LHFLYVVAKPIHLSKTTLAVGWFEPQTSDYQIMANLPISLIFFYLSWPDNDTSLLRMKKNGFCVG
jgi:hypothetical protein